MPSGEFLHNNEPSDYQGLVNFVDNLTYHHKPIVNPQHTTLRQFYHYKIIHLIL
nr:MAG TPA: hypothetical protein [Caudoviricetes sp.]